MFSLPILYILVYLSFNFLYENRRWRWVCRRKLHPLPQRLLLRLLECHPASRQDASAAGDVHYDVIVVIRRDDVRQADRNCVEHSEARWRLHQGLKFCFQINFTWFKIITKLWLYVICTLEIITYKKRIFNLVGKL